MLGSLSIGQNIFLINKCFKLYLKRALKDYDLNSAEAMVLLMLYRQQEQPSPDAPTSEPSDPGRGQTHDQLLAELHYDKGVMSRTAHSLAAKGYVQLESNPADNRSQLVTLTEPGLAFKPCLIEILRQWSQGLLAGVTDPGLLQSQLGQTAENAAAMVAGPEPSQEEKHV